MIHTSLLYDHICHTSTKQKMWHLITPKGRRDVPTGVPLDLSTPTGMSCIGTYGENCKSDNVSKYLVLLVAFLLLWHEN